MRPFLLVWLIAGLGLSSPVDARGSRISADDLRAHVEILASDEFEGRDTGTPGEEKTVDYIARAFSDAGLKPSGTEGSWFQRIELRRHSADKTEIAVFKGSRKLKFDASELVTINRSGTVTLEKSPVYFAGLGVDEAGKIIGDVSGKIVLLLASGAPHLPAKLQSPRARKQALLDAGAGAVLYVSDPNEWRIMRNRYASATLELASATKSEKIEGAIGARSVVGMVTAAGLDWDKLREQGAAKGFAGTSLGITATLESMAAVDIIESRNVIGKIDGRKPGSGAILYMGHWDHLGICGEEGAQDRICNGAVDNASGIAVLIEVAERLSRQRNDRDIYFLATTAEERGLLGAYGYVEKPVFPIEDIVAVLNVDTIAIAPRKADVAIIGLPSKKMSSIVGKLAKKQRRKLDTPIEANDFLRRQDGWVFTQREIPAFMIGGAFSDIELLEGFLDSDYHSPNDQPDSDLELGGAAEDGDLHVELGKYLGSTRKYRGEKLTEPEATGATPDE